MRRLRLGWIASWMAVAAAAPAAAADRVLQAFGRADLNPALLAHPDPPVAATWGPWIDSHPSHEVAEAPVPDALRLTVTAPDPAAALRTVTLLTVDHPPIDADDVALVGTVSWAGTDGRDEIDGTAFLQVTADLPDGSHQVTRTVAEAGSLTPSLMAMHGRWGERFALPLHTPPGQRPVRLRLDLLVPGQGRFEFKGLALRTADSSPAVAMNLPAAFSLPADGVGRFVPGGAGVVRADVEPADRVTVDTDAADGYLLLTARDVGPATVTLWDGQGHPHTIAVTVVTPPPPPADDARPVRLFMAADAAAGAAAASTPGVTCEVAALNGGSDPTPFRLSVTRANDQVAEVAVFDVPLPPDARPGDVLVGRVWASQAKSGNLFSNAQDSAHAHLLLRARAAGGVWSPLAQVGVTARAAASTAASAVVGLPVPFDAADRPDRLQLWLRAPCEGVAPTTLATVFTDLRLVHADGRPAMPPPATRPTTAASPPWPADADHVVRDFGGNDFDPRLSGNNSPDDPVSDENNGSHAITVWGSSPLGLRTVPILSVDDPGVTADRFAITGSVSYGGVGDVPAVDGYGYLEMVADFADGTQAVVRGTAGSGPERAITGRSGERPFALSADAAGRHVARVRLNLVMSDRGVVTLSNLKLAQIDPPVPATRPAGVAAAALPPPGWARPRVVNTAVGLFGPAVLLALAGVFLASSRLVGVALGVAVGVAGQACFGWAMAIAGRGGPAAVYGPLLACAAVGGCVPALIPLVRRRHRDAELRRMRALDAVAA